MAAITVRNIDESLKRRLRIRAAENGRSMEAEARDILRMALERQEERLDEGHGTALRERSAPFRSAGQDGPPTENLGTAIHGLFAPLGGVELDIPPREPMREPPTFD